MNIQDISDFLDLVKNPDKYNKFVEDIKAEQARLKAAVETVAKASELDKLIKEYNKKTAAFEKSVFDKQKEIDDIASRNQQALLARQAVAEQAQINAQAVLQEASTKAEQANKLAESFAGREKELRKQETFVEEQKKVLASQIAEYEEKLTKIRSVLG